MKTVKDISKIKITSPLTGESYTWSNGNGATVTIKKVINNIEFENDYSFLLRVSKFKLKELGVLDEYNDHRGGDKFDEEGYDYITIFQAKIIGLIK